VIVAIVLLTCLVCPLVELFDHWDHTLQTGNDMEYTLVVLALCIGIVFALVRLTVALFSNFLVTSASSRLVSLTNASFFLIAAAIFAAASTSPPLNLRI
jgi:Ca2+/Na+ antiporter